MVFINGAEGNLAPIYSVYPDFKSGHLGEFRVLLGDRILEANKRIVEMTSDVVLTASEETIETPLRPDLVWPPGAWQIYPLPLPAEPQRGSDAGAISTDQPGCCAVGRRWNCSARSPRMCAVNRAFLLRFTPGCSTVGSATLHQPNGAIHCQSKVMSPKPPPFTGNAEADRRQGVASFHCQKQSDELIDYGFQLLT